MYQYQDVTYNKVQDLIMSDDDGQGMIARKLKRWLGNGGIVDLQRLSNFRDNAIEFEIMSGMTYSINTVTGNTHMIGEVNRFMDAANELSSKIEAEINAIICQLVDSSVSRTVVMGVDLSTQPDQTVIANRYLSQDQIKHLHESIETAAQLPKGMLFGDWDYEEVGEDDDK